MDTSEVLKNELNFFKHHTRVFTTSEVVDDIADYNASLFQIHDAFSKDQRFLYIGKTDTDSERFISKKSLVDWFIYLTICLSQAKHPYINICQLRAKMSSLGIIDKEGSMPKEIINFGQDLGFLGPACKNEKYFFPLAHILSFVKSYPSKVIGNLIRDSLEPMDVAFEQFMIDTVEQAIYQLKPRETYVILARGNLSIDHTNTCKFLCLQNMVVSAKRKLSLYNRKTLGQIARALNVTRARVGQIEKKTQSRRTLIRPFLTVIIRDIITQHGSLIYGISSTTPIRIFIAKCLHIPFASLTDMGLLVIGSKCRQFARKKPPKTVYDYDSVKKRIESERDIKLISSDIITLANCFTNYRLKKPKIRDRVLWALQAIGKPAHYSVITDVYNSMFPESTRLESSVHAALSMRNDKEVVWIGSKGMYALREWGYKKPSKSLSDTVNEIVLKKYKIFHKPVPFEVIIAELGKYRKFINRTSLEIIVSMNPFIKQVSRGFFVPEKSARYQKSDSGDKIDKILSEFEKKLRK